jgi:hypothetical protein
VYHSLLEGQLPVMFLYSGRRRHRTAEETGVGYQRLGENVLYDGNVLPEANVELLNLAYRPLQSIYYTKKDALRFPEKVDGKISDVNTG